MNDAEPSLFLARHEHAYGQSHHNHLKQHQKFHNKRQTTVIETATAEASAITEVYQTISVVQQVDVDSDGSTLAVQTFPASDYTSLNIHAAATTTPSTSSSTSTHITTTPSTDLGAQATSSGQAVLSLSSSTDVTSTSTSTSTPSTSFSTLTPNSNSTTLISSSIPNSTPVSVSVSISGTFSSSTTLFSNATASPSISSSSSTTSTSSTSLTTNTTAIPFAGSTSTSSFETFASTITSSFLSSSPFLSSAASSTSSISDSNTFSSSSSPSQTDSTSSSVFVGGGTGTGSASGGSGATNTAVAGSGSSGNGTDNTSTPSTSTIVGGVVGGVAGLAAILFLLMFVLRWKKKNGGMLSLGSVPPSAVAGGGSSRGAGGIGGSDSANQAPGFSNQAPRSMTERRSLAMGVPAALASLSKNKRSSQNTATNTISSAGSERGFYRVSGKKLPSVLQHGGDGYAEPNPNTLSGSSFYPSGVPPIPNSNTLSGTSFYRDSQGFYGGQPSPPLEPTNRDSGVPVMRPSPARTPVTEHGPFAEPPVATPPRPDLLGRSHPSQDGSHPSRFTEEV
ncbi:hypothetical protein BTUL_0292g00050 [Botrytis tulipae]|uniref:REJ domain-containing protein n=1 Tax=Botrytis tulipae TaxID=87230 RepID=A0A4Z1E7Y0_9HELO|nr:hypothetical protein BTUL_0292g00050 [Botrytis tulipae]